MKRTFIFQKKSYFFLRFNRKKKSKTVNCELYKRHEGMILLMNSSKIKINDLLHTRIREKHFANNSFSLS